MVEERIESHLQNFNNLIGGHYPGIPAILFARSTAGKSILVQQFCYDFLDTGNCLWYDTEGGGLQMLREWMPALNERFGIKARVTDDLTKSSKRGTIYVITKRSVVAILKDLGYEIRLEVTSGGEGKVGKINLRLEGLCDSIVEETVSRKNIKYLVFDSYTNPLKLTFVGGRVQFPARSDAVNLWLASLVSIIDTYPIVCYGICHEGLDPASRFATPKVSGPGSLYYNNKIVLWLDPTKSKKKQRAGEKFLWAVRYFNTAPWTKVAPLKLTDRGYTDVVYDADTMLKKAKRLIKKRADEETKEEKQADKAKKAKKARRKKARKRKKREEDE